MKKRTGYRSIGFNEFLEREEIAEDNRRAAKELEEQEIRDLQKEKLEKEIELLNKPTITESTANNALPQNDKSSQTNILKWEGFFLDINNGRASLVGKTRIFNTKKPAFHIYRALLEKRLLDPNDGSVTYSELRRVTGLKTKKQISQVIRHLRKNLEINKNKNPHHDIFQATGEGYSLVNPLIV